MNLDFANRLLGNFTEENARGSTSNVHGRWSF